MSEFDNLSIVAERQLPGWSWKKNSGITIDGVESSDSYFWLFANPSAMAGAGELHRVEPNWLLGTWSSSCTFP